MANDSKTSMLPNSPSIDDIVLILDKLGIPFLNLSQICFLLVISGDSLHSKKTLALSAHENISQ